MPDKFTEKTRRVLFFARYEASQVLGNHGVSYAAVREELQGDRPAGMVKKAQTKPTACRDCKHLIVEGPIAPTNLFCGASPPEQCSISTSTNSKSIPMPRLRPASSHAHWSILDSAGSLRPNSRDLELGTLQRVSVVGNGLILITAPAPRSCTL